MSFRVRRENSLSNFPIKIQSEVPIAEPVITDINSDGIFEFIVVADSIYLFDAEGNPIQLLSPRPFIGSECETPPVFAQTTIGQILLTIVSGIDSSLIISAWKFTEDFSINFIRDWVIGNTIFVNRPILTSNVLAFGDFLYCGLEDEGTHNYLSVKISIALPTIVYNFGNCINSYARSDEDIFALYENGNVLMFKTSSGYTSIGQVDGKPIGEMVVGYINSNTEPDIVVCTETGIFLILDPIDSSSTVLNYSLNSYYPNPILIDIDNDDKLEIVIADSQKVYAFTDQLILEANFPISIPNQYRNKYFEPYLLTNEVSGDGILDVITIIHDIGIVAFDKLGKAIDGFPIVFPNNISSTKTLIKSANGTIEIAVSNDGKTLNGTFIGSELLSENAWTCLGGGADRSFFYSAKSEAPVTTTKSLLDKKKTYNWPNPVKGTKTAIRYFPNKSCDISIDIYDLAGDFVDSYKDSHPVVGEDNEIEWNVSNVESGVYFAVVKATSGSKIDSKI
ncbi:MAG: T9SS type A sorting domain-containing protein, partial [Thermoplasmatales archaeon]|nr:T9SS type A sorting domain-containing protein [Thermoplasmatales archaeon]